MNGTKPKPAISPEGAASSETSESQSVTDDPATARPAGKIIKAKPTKEVVVVDKERPPWRSTVAPKPTVDRSAMIRARLLEASRRALISHRLKFFSKATQTDLIPTKLCRDADTDTQVDLILMRDQSIETDGAVTIKSEVPGGFILTQTIGQMTDAVCINDCYTQTAQPRSNLSFARYLQRDSDSPSEDEQPPKQRRVYRDHDIDDALQKNAKILQAQIKEIQKLDDELNAKQKSRAIPDTEDSSPPISMNQKVASPTIERNQNESYRRPYQRRNRSRPKRSYSAGGRNRSFLNEPTLASWDNFDSTDEDDPPPLPRRYISNGQSPWADYQDMVIGKRVANMHLSPIPPRLPSTKKKSVSWNDTQQQAIADLMSEANALINVFDQMSMVLGPKLRLGNLRKMENISRPPPPKWDSALTKAYQSLEDELDKFKPHRFRDDLCKGLDDD